MQLNVVSEAELPDHVEQGLKRDPLGVEQQFICGIEDPQIAEHLALRGQERGVAALTALQALHVVTDLPLQERLGVGAGQRELAAIGAIEQRRRPR